MTVHKYLIVKYKCSSEKLSEFRCFNLCLMMSRPTETGNRRGLGVWGEEDGVDYFEVVPAVCFCQWLNTDGSFTTAVSNSFLSPLEKSWDN